MSSSTSISHDLAEPVRTLIGFSDFLVKDHAPQLGPQGAEYLGYLVDAAQRMRSMIHGLLNLSRAGKVTGEFGPVPLGELIAAGQLRARRADPEPRGDRRRDLSPEVVLWGDGRRLHQLLANLVSNAIKYNRSAPPRVEIGAVEPACGIVEEAHDPDRVQTFFVRDNGIGIDPRFHDIIFQPFRRLHAPDEFEGTGVGLALCAKIVQAHGGQIRVESAPGQGATFFVSLPPGPPAAGAPRHERDRTLVLEPGPSMDSVARPASAPRSRGSAG